MSKAASRLLFVALAAIMLFAACEDEQSPPTPTPTPTPSPTPTPVPTPTATPVPADGVDVPGAPAALEIIEKSYAAMLEAQSLHFELNGTITLGTGGTETEVPVKFEGDVQAPDRVSGKLSLSLGFFNLEMESIVIGDMSYTTDPLTGEWQVGEGLASALPSPTEFVLGAEDELEDVVLLGVETLDDGAEVYHLSATPPSEIFGGADADARAEFWFGVEDSYLHQIGASGELDLGDVAGQLSDLGLSGTVTIDLTMRLSAFGEPVVIEAPDLH